MTGIMNSRYGGKFRQGSRTGSKSTTTKSSTSKLIEQKMLNDYKYTIRTMKQMGDYNKITTYLILHIRKMYEHGSDIADAIERQEPFNFKPSAPKLQILLIVETEDTTPKKSLKSSARMISIRSNMRQNYNCISSEKVIITQTRGKHMHFYFDNAQQAYSVE